MNYTTWEDMLYTAAEFRDFSEKSNGFKDDVNRNSRIRDDNMHFADFVDAGSTALINNSPGFVASLI